MPLHPTGDWCLRCCSHNTRPRATRTLRAPVFRASRRACGCLLSFTTCIGPLAQPPFSLTQPHFSSLTSPHSLPLTHFPSLTSPNALTLSLLASHCPPPCPRYGWVVEGVRTRMPRHSRGLTPQWRRFVSYSTRPSTQPMFWQHAPPQAVGTGAGVRAFTGTGPLAASDAGIIAGGAGAGAGAGASSGVGDVRGSAGAGAWTATSTGPSASGRFDAVAATLPRMFPVAPSLVAGSRALPCRFPLSGVPVCDPELPAFRAAQRKRWVPCSCAFVAGPHPTPWRTGGGGSGQVLATRSLDCRLQG